MEKWYKGMYRRQLTDMHIADESPEFLSKFNPDEYYECLKKANIQSPMIYLQSHTGLCNYPTKVARTHKYFEKNPYGIKKLIDKCHEGGMKVVGYYSLIFNNLAQEMHPDWAIRYANGDTWQDRGQRYGLCCPNNKEYRAFVDEQIKELAEFYPDLEGIFYDMPYWEVTCHCPACTERWQKEVGGEMPGDIPDWNNPRWLLYVKKRQDWMVEFVEYAKGVAEKYLPKSTIEFNFAAAVSCDWLGGSTEGINDFCEYTGGDLYGDIYSHSFAAKYYYGITKNQPFEYMTCRCNKRLKEHTITKPLETLEQEIAVTTAHHGATLNIDAINPDGSLDMRVYEKLGKAFEKQIEYEPYMDKGALYSDVAVYFDTKTQFDVGLGTYNKLAGVEAHKTLAENHILTSVVANGNLDNLQKYQMVIAPCMQDFDNDEVLKFIDYVKNGGTLYISGNGDSRLMKEFFGGVVNDKTFGNSPFPHIEKAKKEVQAYVNPMPDIQEEFGEFNKKYPLPVTYKLPIISGYKKECKVLATITLPYSDPDDNSRFASIHSNPPWEDTDIPAMLEVEYYKGKVIWSSAVIESDPRLNFKDIFASIVNKNIKPLFNIKASKYVECVVFNDKKDYYVSFVDLCEEFTERKAEISFANADEFVVETLPDEKVVYSGNKYICEFEKWTMFRLYKK